MRINMLQNDQLKFGDLSTKSQNKIGDLATKPQKKFGDFDTKCLIWIDKRLYNNVLRNIFLTYESTKTRC